MEGLPSDITMEEFIDYFSKAGIVRKDEESGISFSSSSAQFSPLYS